MGLSAKTYFDYGVIEGLIQEWISSFLFGMEAEQTVNFVIYITVRHAESCFFI